MKNRSSLRNTLIFLILLFGCCFFYSFLYGQWDRKPEPLDQETVQYLCTNLKLPPDDPLCLSNVTPLASDFIPAFKKIFIPGVTPYEEIINFFTPLAETYKSKDQFEQDYISTEDNTSVYGQYERRVYDFAGDGFNKVIFISNPGYVSSILLENENESSEPIAKQTIAYLCDQLSISSSEKLCLTEIPVYVQDFLPLIRQSFLLHTTKRIIVEKVLLPFLITEEPLFYRIKFYFGDNVGSQILFLFNSNQILENMFFMNVATLNLEADVKNDLCVKFNLAIDDKRCNPEANIDTSDFKELVYESFLPGKATYEDVQNLLGKYQFGFDPPIRDANGDATMLSWYDFVGNNYYRIRFDFDTDGVVTEISFFYGDD